MGWWLCGRFVLWSALGAFLILGASWSFAIDFGSASGQLSLAQQVFILFYAIFWGFVSEVQPPWKPFNWPVALRAGRTAERLSLAFGFFVVLPIAAFAVMFRLFAADGGSYLPAVLLPLLAAHLPFGLHRLWLSELEMHPRHYYFTARQLGELSDHFILTHGYQRSGPRGAAIQWSLPPHPHSEVPDDPYYDLAAAAELQKLRWQELVDQLDLLRRQRQHPKALCQELEAEATRIDFPISDVEPSVEKLNLYPLVGNRNRRVAVFYLAVSVSAAALYRLGVLW